jgi:small subunit ribosomal protein S7
VSKHKLSNLLSDRGVIILNKTDAIKQSWFTRKLVGSLPLKSKARNKSVFYKALQRIKREYKVDPFAVLAMAAHILKPDCWIKVLKNGKREYRIPRRLTPIQQYKYSLKWIVRAIKERPETTLEDKIFFEISDILKGNSKVFFWKSNLKKEVRRNKHNVRFKW